MSKYCENYFWLEYSVKEDKVYCFICKNFSSGNIKDQYETFVKSGFSNWKKLNEKLKKHEQSDQHTKCSEKYVSYKHSLTHGKVCDQKAYQHEEEVVQNRNYALKLIDIILCLTRQRLSLRGHDENESSVNPGIFL